MSYDTRAEYKDGMAFDVDLGGHDLRVDAGTDHGGRNYGPTPRSMMLAALSGCTGMDVVAILRKMQMPYDSFAIEVRADSADQHPHVYTAVTVRYLFSGQKVEREKVEKAVTLSLDRYCPVAATLRHTARIDYEIVINQ
ncbi:MAG: OsmC family peroxiredoxin [Spirochaetaceae bacterium]|nr:MAG: OsmC family peroxiredoxin [Spirochaetaceae bacterium]